jgi:hypothetical protein
MKSELKRKTMNGGREKGRGKYEEEVRQEDEDGRE